MPTQLYYELLKELETTQKRQTSWRWKIAQALEGLRVSLASHLGIEYLHYNEGQYRYVDLFTPANDPFHLSASNVIEFVERTPVVNVHVVIALEHDVRIVPCICPIQVRLIHNTVEYRITRENGHWTSNLDVIRTWICKAIKNNLRQVLFVQTNNIETEKCLCLPTSM
ncbi:hypothetical protein I9G03_002550 [Vibrio parahaemolyticus]|nr:hypothetical protein [Vibrio parahaemolyticus]